MAVRSCGSTVVIYSGVAIVFSWESYNSLFMDSVSSSTAGHRASSYIFSSNRLAFVFPAEFGDRNILEIYFAALPAKLCRDSVNRDEKESANAQFREDSINWNFLKH